MNAVAGRLGNESCAGGRKKDLCVGFGRVGVGGRDGAGKRWHWEGTTLLLYDYSKYIGSRTHVVSSSSYRTLYSTICIIRSDGFFRDCMRFSVGLEWHF